MADQVQLSFLEWVASQEQARRTQYQTYREYYDGEQAAQLTERLRRILMLKTGNEFSLNLCAAVVDSLAERLNVTGFDAGSQSDQLWQWWEADRMDGTQTNLHLATVRDGDSYILVDWDKDEKRPTFWHELASDGDGVLIHYGERRQVPTFASKRWRVEDGPDAGKMRRLNLYYPEKIEKYYSDDDEFEGNWRQFIEAEGDSWPTPWVDAENKPLGVPVVHFRNRAQGYNYGQSEQKAAIGPQNGLNKSVIDLLLAADVSAFRLPWVVGGSDPGSPDIGPGAIMHFPDPETRPGEWSSADLSPLLLMVDQFKLSCAQVTRTPTSAFQLTRQVAAEGTLKQQESGLVAKAKNRQRFFGNSWEDCMIMARRLSNVFGEGGMDETQIISTQWSDPETRNELDMAQVAAVHVEKLGVPREVAWRKVGYTQAEIDEMLASDEHQARTNLMRLGMTGGVAGGEQDSDEESEE